MSAALTDYSAERLKQEFGILVDGGLRGFFLPTREPIRAQHALQDYASANGFGFFTWDTVRGIQTYRTVRHEGVPAEGRYLPIPNTNVANSNDLTKAFDHIGKLQESSNPNATQFIVAFRHADNHFVNPFFQEQLRQQLLRSADNVVVLVFICGDHVTMPPPVEHELRVLNFDTPSAQDYIDCLDSLLSAAAENIPDPDAREALPKFGKEDKRRIAHAAAGMSQQEFSHAIGIILSRGDYVAGDDEDEVNVLDCFLQGVLLQKTEIINKTDLLELMPPATMDEVGGLDLALKWLKKRRVAFSDAAREQGVAEPRGVLLVGPPGTGKSLWAKACAHVLRQPCVKFDVGRVFGKFVGESESQMRKALKFVEAMAPCVLLVDEVDKGFGSGAGGGDAGTTSRVFGTFLTWMQERKAPVFVVMTANNVVGMPPELMRRGRLDEIFSVTFPNVDERKQILEIHLRKRGDHKIGGSDEGHAAAIAEVAAATSGFVGGELEALVKEAVLTAVSSKEPLTSAMMISAAEEIVPMSKAWADKIAAMDNWAKSNARPSSSEYEEAARAPSGGGIFATRNKGATGVNPARQRLSSIKPKPGSKTPSSIGSTVHDN